MRDGFTQLAVKLSTVLTLQIVIDMEPEQEPSPSSKAKKSSAFANGSPARPAISRAVCILFPTHYKEKGHKEVWKHYYAISHLGGGLELHSIAICKLCIVSAS